MNKRFGQSQSIQVFILNVELIDINLPKNKWYAWHLDNKSDESAKFYFNGYSMTNFSVNMRSPTSN